MEDLFQLDGAARRPRIVVAMSGGVDSSVVAALAAASGAETIGITLQLYDHGAAVGRTGSCCAGTDIADARAVAERLGIAHYVFDYESAFRESVIDRFADDYVAGRTPIPCVRCNQGVKFTDLLRLARELGADCLATGHYVRRVVGPHGPELHRALDPARDQSYFLFATTRAQLDFLRFPLGGMAKQRVREIAMEHGLVVADKPDSQDICFVPDGDYAGLVRKLRPAASAPGEIVDLAGEVVGRHRGVAGFTVGQRRGIEIGGAPEPLYVVRIDAAERRLVVGPRAALAVRAARLEDVNWLGEGRGGALTAKIRSLAKPVPARFDGGTVRFETPEYGVAPGQAAVLYDGDRVLGGGWIAETFAPPILRRAGPDDAARLALLGGATFLQSFAHDHPGDAIVAHADRQHSRDWYAERLADPACAIWLLETDRGAPIGYTMLGRPALDCPTDGADLELKRLYLLAGWQSGGWGARLLAAVEAEARARGAGRLLLCVYDRNHGAQRFYARHGFEDIGQIQNLMVGDTAFQDLIWAKALA